jgi:hypothetical protein
VVRAGGVVVLGAEGQVAVRGTQAGVRGSGTFREPAYGPSRLLRKLFRTVILWSIVDTGCTELAWCMAVKIAYAAA